LKKIASETQIETALISRCCFICMWRWCILVAFY